MEKEQSKSYPFLLKQERGHTINQRKRKSCCITYKEAPLKNPLVEHHNPRQIFPFKGAAAYVLKKLFQLPLTIDNEQLL